MPLRLNRVRSAHRSLSAECKYREEMMWKQNSNMKQLWVSKFSGSLEYVLLISHARRVTKSKGKYPVHKAFAFEKNWK